MVHSNQIPNSTVSPVSARMPARSEADKSDDRIYAFTRITTALTIPFLVAAFYVLYFRTGETGTLFSWNIAAPMSAIMLSAAYLGGTYYFVRVLLERRWHRVALGFVPVAAFSLVLGISTALHLNVFNRNLPFYTWAFLYATTQFIFLGVWLHNRRADPGTPEAHDYVYPTWVRVLLGAAGIANAVLSLALLINPALVIAVWPWSLTPLTGRAIASLFAFQGLFLLNMARDPRWSSVKLVVEVLWLGIAVMATGIVRTWNTFDPTRTATWIFVGVVAMVIVGLPVLYIAMERKVRQNLAGL